MGLSNLQPRLQVAVRTIAPVSAAERIRKGPRRNVVPGRVSARKSRPLQGGALRRWQHHWYIDATSGNSETVAPCLPISTLARYFT